MRDNVLLQRLMEMGIVDGAKVTVLGFAPLGCPMRILVGECQLAIRKLEAKGITMEV